VCKSQILCSRHLFFIFFNHVLCPLFKLLNSFANNSSRSFEMSASWRYALLIVPFVIILIPDNPLNNFIQLIFGLLNKAIFYQNLNHSPTEPRPISSILISIFNWTARIHKYSCWIRWIYCDSDSNLSTSFFSIFNLSPITINYFVLR